MPEPLTADALQALQIVHLAAIRELLRTLPADEAQRCRGHFEDQMNALLANAG